MAEGDDDGPRSVVSGEKVRIGFRTVASSTCRSLPAEPSLALWTCRERVGPGMLLIDAWACGASPQIKMKVKKSSSDKVRETNRADLLRFLNSSYD